MGNEHSLRINRGTYQQHADDTHRNNANFKSAGDEADRQQGYLQNMTEDGVGSEEMGAARHSTRGAMDDLHTANDKNARRTSENADEFIANVSRSARGIKS